MSSPVKQLSLTFAAQSDIGLVRTENQDSFGKFPEDDINLYNGKGQLFIVADGMGGHQGGKQASTIAVKVVSSEYFESHLEESIALKEAIETANQTIFNQAGRSSEFGRMGTTCSVLLLNKEKGIIGHVGDSRIYKIENGKIEQLTDDHTKVQEMLREGILTPEEAHNYPSKSVLSRALGVDDRIRVDIINNIVLNKTQSYIMCSDGLAKVGPNEILPIVSNNSPEEACRILVGLANDRGGKDNVTVIVIKIDPDYRLRVPEFIPVEPKLKVKPDRNKNKIVLWFGIAAAFICVLLILFFLLKPSIFSSFSDTPSNNKSTKISDADEKLLIKANSLVLHREYDSALVIYKKILDNEPMHQAALRGINEIATAYLSNANNLMYMKKFEDALTYYKKVEAIQPDNEIVKNRIMICTSQISYKPKVDSASANTSPDENGVAGSLFTSTKFDSPGWNYPGTNKNEFNIKSYELDFTNTLSQKFVIYNRDFFDVTLIVGTIFNDPNSSAGIIVGYNSSTDYYIFKHHFGGEYILQKIDGSNVNNLLVIKPDPGEKMGNNLLKVQYTNNLISIYNENGLLSSYKSLWGIYGRAGLFVDKNSTVKFLNIFLSGKTKLD